MLQRTFFFSSYVCGSFSFRSHFLRPLKRGVEEVKKGRKWIGKSGSQEKYSCSCVLEWWIGLSVDVASLATSIMAFYSTGKIDSVIEQFFLFPLLALYLSLFWHIRRNFFCLCLLRVLVYARVRKFNFKWLLQNSHRPGIFPSAGRFHNRLNAFFFFYFFLHSLSSCVPFPN